jgi:hypothetical protein
VTYAGGKKKPNENKSFSVHTNESGNQEVGKETQLLEPN